MAKTITFTPPLAPPTTGLSATPAAGGSLAASTRYYYKVVTVVAPLATTALWNGLRNFLRVFGDYFIIEGEVVIY